jgi:hypothetical protein
MRGRGIWSYEEDEREEENDCRRVEKIDAMGEWVGRLERIQFRSCWRRDFRRERIGDSESPGLSGVVGEPDEKGVLGGKSWRDELVVGESHGPWEVYQRSPLRTWEYSLVR